LTLKGLTHSDSSENHRKKLSFVRIVVDYREHKADPYRVRYAVGGKLIDFPGEKSTKTADLFTVKGLLNNIISTSGARQPASTSRTSS
jgi:hypothetical protein